ncbi:hypothetical protein PENTCL1PPCAC_24097, partial [Pristionchus entomophagus]
EAITVRAAILLNKFNLKNYIFDSICFDDNLLSFSGKVTFSTVHVFYCSVDNNQSKNGETRLYSALVSNKPTGITITLAGDRSFTSEKFLSEYAHAVPLSSLQVNNGRRAKRSLVPS